MYSMLHYKFFEFWENDELFGTHRVFEVVILLIVESLDFY